MKQFVGIGNEPRLPENLITRVHSYWHEFRIQFEREEEIRNGWIIKCLQ